MANRAERRNISITDPELSTYLDTQVQNVSGFIQEALWFYINNHEKVEYARAADLEALQEDFQILNRNYLEMRDILNEVVQSFME